MKRKAMLMGMAVMTSMPGWAMATGTGKAASAAHPYSRGMAAEVTLGKVEFDYVTSRPDQAGTVQASPGKTAELLAQIKSMLKKTSYGLAAQPTVDKLGWRMELLESAAWAYDGIDPRLQKAKPVGVAFRFMF